MVRTHTMLEYLIAVYGLFTERLLNIKWNLTRKNIDKESETLREILNYFNSQNVERTDVAKDKQLTAAQNSKQYIAY